MLGYLSLDIICSSKLTVFLELHSLKTVRVSEQIISADKYSSIFLPQMEAVVYISVMCGWQISRALWPYMGNARICCIIIEVIIAITCFGWWNGDQLALTCVQNNFIWTKMKASSLKFWPNGHASRLQVEDLRLFACPFGHLHRRTRPDGVGGMGEGVGTPQSKTFSGKTLKIRGKALGEN